MTTATWLCDGLCDPCPCINGATLDPEVFADFVGPNPPGLRDDYEPPARPVHETRREKAQRLVLDSRVRVSRAEEGRYAVGSVVGDHGTYRVGWTPSGFVCDCPARRWDCAHALAFALVTGPTNTTEGSTT